MPPPVPLMKDRLQNFFHRQPRGWLWAEAIALSCLVGYLDYVTGYEVSLVLFYALPIMFMVWFDERMSGVFISILCSLIWWWSDIASGHPYAEEWHRILDTAVRLGFFLTIVVAVSAIKTRLVLQKDSQRLEQKIIRVSEREQRRIGRDLHDGLCQYYAAVGCAAASLKHNLEKQGSDGAKAAAEIEDLIMKGVDEARSLARGLSPVESDGRGLQRALENLADSTSRLLGVKCWVMCDDPAPVFGRIEAEHLYRIAQEAINNAHRHGRAREILVRLERDGERVIFAVEDDGTGVASPRPTDGGMGLSVMQYRARIIGAEWKIEARPGGGTTVACSFHGIPPDPTTDEPEDL